MNARGQSRKRVLRLDALPAPDDKGRAVTEMFDAVAPRYDFLNRLLTIRMDVRWRRAAVKLLALRPGACVLDMACGTGDLCVELTAAGLTPIGIDRSAGMLAAAHTNAPLARADVDDLPLRSGSVDGVTCGLALRNFSRIDTFLASAARVLARGGRLAILEPSRPRTPVSCRRASSLFRTRRAACRRALLGSRLVPVASPIAQLSAGPAGHEPQVPVAGRRVAPSASTTGT
ncbi:MAG: demethylmenaquinone methyltransferase / 2-methoxy-6-polyprenyl,4-benzoquinol methylase [Acidimicrobiaceae bacterium]